MVYSLTWLPEVLLAAGLKVAEQPGWRTRGHGDVGTIRGVMCHHTGTARGGVMPTLDVITRGRSDLAGPLAQLGLGRDGTYFVVAAGRAYHAGGGIWQKITTGNSSFIGIEAENAGGAADAWPPVQMDAYRRGVAALLKKIGADAEMCCGHREYAPHRKNDPRFDMDEFRRQVRAVMADTAPPTLIPRVDPEGRATLRRGDRGEQVKVVQKVLGIGDDGIFGPDTEAAVRAFQRTMKPGPDGRPPVDDGIVGPKTWQALDEAVQT